MRKIFLIAAAAGLGLTGVAANAGSPGSQPAFAVNDKAGLSSQLVPVKVDSKLYDYCAKVIADVKRGKSASKSSTYAAGDCVEIFVDASIPGGMTPAQSGQAGKGGDGGGVAGLPGGKGGAAGGTPGASGSGASASANADVDDELLDYCSAVLKQSRPGSIAKKPVSSDYEASDCVDYFASLDPSSAKGAASGTGSAARSGTPGASISGGQGGAGGAKGGGPGGASGGSGGVGVGGGTGGKGGAGGGGY